MTNLLTKIKAVIKDRESIYLDWLVKLCQQPSVAAQNLGMVEAANMVETLLKEIGATVQQIPTSGFPVVYGELGTGNTTLSFYNHYDVQPTDPLEAWHYDPFAAHIEDGILYARGVADNKGNLVARIAAIDAYLRAGGTLTSQLKFIIEGEEEIGSPLLSDFVDAHQDLVQADGCIWESGYADPQGRREVHLGVKGLVYVELTAKTANIDLHSSWAGIIPNAAWHLLNALQSLKDAEGNILIPGFYDNVRPPTKSERTALKQMAFDETGYLKQLGLNNFNNNLNGLPLLETYLFQPTCNICGIWSGYIGEGSKTVLPNLAKAKLDFRLVADQDPERIIKLLKKHLSEQGFADIEVDVMWPEHPARTPISHPLAQLAINTSKQVFGTEPIVYPTSAGTGPMHIVCQQFGIPTVSVGVGHADSRVHAPNESIYLDHFYQGIAHIAAIIDGFGRGT